MTTSAFTGAKAALLCAGRILTLQRDTHPGLPWPGMWDLPGGGREGDETPTGCLLRELHEEFGLTLPATRLTFARPFPAMTDPAATAWFFAGSLTRAEVATIRFGSEGQGWQMMPLDEWLAHPAAIRQLQERTAIALTSQPPNPVPIP